MSNLSNTIFQALKGDFSLVKRGITGSFHHVSEAHLHRYLAEFDFRYNNRIVSDYERLSASIRGIVGKRLTY